MLRFRWIQIGTDSHISGETGARHEIADENILLLDDFHVEQMRKRLAIENRNHFRIGEDERERRRNIRTENRASILLHSSSEELLRSLEPEVIQPVADGSEQRPTVTAGDISHRQSDRRRRYRRRYRRHSAGGHGDPQRHQISPTLHWEFTDRRGCLNFSGGVMEGHLSRDLIVKPWAEGE